MSKKNVSLLSLAHFSNVIKMNPYEILQANKNTQKQLIKTKITIIFICIFLNKNKLPQKQNVTSNFTFTLTSFYAFNMHFECKVFSS